MRSGHSLAFQYFEEVLSEARFNILIADEAVTKLASSVETFKGELTAPFSMEWEAESDGNQMTQRGFCRSLHFDPIPDRQSHGQIIRSVGYAEAEQAITDYSFSSDGTLVLRTIYGQSIAEREFGLHQTMFAADPQF